MASPQNPFTANGEPGGWHPESTTHFGEPASFGSAAFQIVKPPVKILLAAAALALIGIFLAVIFWESWPAIGGWILSGPIAIGVLALYIKIDTDNRSMPTYVRPDHTGFLYGGTWILVAVGIFLSAWCFAVWAGHR